MDRGTWSIFLNNITGSAQRTLSSNMHPLWMESGPVQTKSWYLLASSTSQNRFTPLWNQLPHCWPRWCLTLSMHRTSKLYVSPHCISSLGHRFGKGELGCAVFSSTVRSYSGSSCTSCDYNRERFGPDDKWVEAIKEALCAAGNLELINLVNNLQPLLQENVESGRPTSEYHVVQNVDSLTRFW